jgi:peptidyl-prolyl cis-trans isomerase C
MRLVLLSVAFSLLSCTSGSNQEPTRQSLPEGVAARVGGELVDTRTIARIASARRVAPTEARDLAIKDALFAAWARHDSANAPAVVVAERAALGRALLEALEAEAMNAGSATDAELAELVAERWTELDRPPSVRTTHAVIRVKKPEDAAPGLALAERLARELRGITDAAAFIERASAFDAKPFELVTERLNPVTPDGRVWEPNGRPGSQLPSGFDLDYARAANAIERAGEQSPVVKTAFGYHVILLDERLPERRLSPEERRAALEHEIVSRRARKLVESTVARLRSATPIERERNEDSLTELAARAP